MDEHDIHHAFTKGDMTFREAVIRLQKIGYDPKEAWRVANEWADNADFQMNGDFNEQQGGY